MKFMVNGIETEIKAAMDEVCDYCGEHGHQWQKHPEAHADVAAWQAEYARMTSE